MNPFYDLNKRLADLSAKQDAAQLSESKQADHVAQSPLTQALNESNAKKVPDLPIDKKGIKKHYGGSVVKMGSAAKDAGFSDARIRQTGEKFLQGKLKEEELDEAGYSAKAGRAGKDLGKPGKNFSKIAKGAAERYGSKAAGERVAGAVLNKLRHPANEGTCPACHCSPCECVEEGNAFTGKLKATPKGGKFKLGDKEFKDTSDIEEGFADMDAWLASREKEKGTGKFDRKERTLPGGMKATTYTRRHEEEPIDGDEKVSTEPKRKGRPKGKDKGPERVTAKSYKYKAGRPAKTNEGDMEGSHDSDESGEFGAEGDYVKNELHTMVRVARDLEKHLRDSEDLPTWCIGKLSQAKGMVVSVMDYIMSEKERGIEQATGKEGITLEKAPPGAKAERMVKGIKKSLSKDGKLSAKDKAIAYATTWKAKKAGKVEEEGLEKHSDSELKAAAGKDRQADEKSGVSPQYKTSQVKDELKKRSKEEVDETTVAGSVATATAAPKAGKGMQFGKGVYESLDRQFKQALTESVNVAETVSENEGEGKTITVTASGPEADMLMQLLKAAGLSGQGSSCGCGQTPCGCDSLEENKPDWPTNTETLDADPELRTYSGGLNGPKSTGQTTIPVVASQLRRQTSVEESVKLERSLFKTWKNYKG